MVVRLDLCLLGYLNIMCFGSYYLCFHDLLRCTYEPYVYILSYTTHIFGCRVLDLVDISMTNPFVLIVTCLLKPSYFKKPQLFSYQRLSSITKKGEIERASRPLVISVINDIIDYYD